MSNVCVVYHSGFGHTKALAQAVAEGARSVGGCAVTLVDVDDLEGPESNQYGEAWAPLNEADAIVFGCPTYMGSVSAGLKRFFEQSSGIWFQQGWKDKLAAGFTNSASQSGDKLNSLVDMAIFAAQHSMIWVSLGLMPGNNSSQGKVTDLNRIGSYLGAMAQSNADEGPDVAPPPQDRETGFALGKRVAEAADRWIAGGAHAAP